MAGPRTEVPRILVVEDEFLIAIELTSILESGGFEVIGPAASVAAALRILADESPDAAVLDVNLRGENVAPVAWALRAEGIPFILASAIEPTDRLLKETLNVGKPTEPGTLLGALKGLFDRQ